MQHRSRWPATGEPSRREAVEGRLAGFAPTRRALPRRVAPWPRAASEEGPALRLREALADLGPVFTAFGRYLGSRLDLLVEADCQTLATLPEAVPPMPAPAVRALLLRELGRTPEEAFEVFDDDAFEATLVYQQHRAEVRPDSVVPGEPAPGESVPVIVRVVRADLEAELARDLPLLSLLGPALATRGLDAARLAPAIDDFVAALAVEADLVRQAAALEALRGDRGAAGIGLSAPRTFPGFCSRGVLTRAAPAGVTLAEVLAAASSPPAGAQTPAATPSVTELAVRLCEAWLRQACFGPAFPQDLRAEDVLVLPSRELLWTGATFAAIPGQVKQNVWEHLVAVASHDPDRAADALLREVSGAPRERAAELRQRLRQLVPYRDGGFAARDDLAGYLFLYWRSAQELGFAPQPHLVAVYRGIARLAVVARRLVPDGDPLREGLERQRLASGMGEVFQMLKGEELQQLMGRYAGAMLAFPERMNELLTMAAEGRLSVKLEMTEPPAERRRKDRSVLALATVGAMVAVVLLATYSGSTAAFGPWAERAAVALLGVLGGFLIWGGRRR